MVSSKRNNPVGKTEQTNHGWVWAVILGILAMVTAMCWGCNRENKDRPAHSVRGSRGGEGEDELLRQAKEGLGDKEYEKAIRLAFEGFNKWYRRAGVRAGKTDQYLQVIFEVMDGAGPGPLLEICVSSKSAHEDRMCEKIILSCFRRGALEKKGFAAALNLFEVLCEERREDLCRFHDLCAGLPEAFIVLPGLRERLLKIMDERCFPENKDVSERSLCHRFLAVLWDSAPKKGEDIQILAPRLVGQGGVEGATRLLQALGSNEIENDVRGTLERAFLQSVGKAQGLTDIVESFASDLGRRERRDVLSRYFSVFSKKMVEVEALLSQLEEGCITRLFNSMADLNIDGLAKMLRELESRLSRQPGVILSRYLGPVRKDRKLKEKVLSLLRNEPLLVQRLLVSKMAFAPLQQRNKYRVLVAQLNPHALGGAVTGMIIPKGLFDNVDLSSCRVQLVEVNTCDEKDSVEPNRRGKNTGSGKGDGDRVRRVVGVNTNGSFAIDHVPVGPYDAFVQCRGRLSWSRFRFGGYVRKSEDADDRVWEDRCVVTVQPLKKTAIVPLHLDYPKPSDWKRPRRKYAGRLRKTLRTETVDSSKTRETKRAVIVE